MEIRELAKASDVIKKLQEMIEAHGDLPVVIYTDSGHGYLVLTTESEDWFHTDERIGYESQPCIAFWS